MAAVHLSQHSQSAIAKVITGDGPPNRKKGVAPYRSGPELVEFFNQFRDKPEYYGRGFPSRWMYAEASLAELGGSMERIINAAFDVRHFMAHEAQIDIAVNYVNPILDFDGYQISKVGRRYAIRKIANVVELDAKTLRVQPGEPDDEFIREQIGKCDEKIATADYDGAITNARSLLEAVLIGLEATLVPADKPYDGDLPQLFKRVQKALNLEPARPDIDQPLRQVLGGLGSIVHGLAPLRNKMSDAHARAYKPEVHHARLVVNATKTAVDFLVGSYRYQKAKGIIGK
jgi:hypothetical protein